ncbi:MAG: hypothetical protein A49_25140 [Methyloceanibacter sp.]|nr:MAG: hypothetical protein A49_25140 [Methyloceanibacter sp.]
MRRADDLEGDGEERIARQDGGGFVEGDMHRGASPAERIVVHGRKIVVDQRVAVNAFERASRIEGRLLGHAEQARGLDEEEGRKRFPPPSAA